LFPVNVVLHPEVRVKVTINVARTEDEAERQARGEDVLAERSDEEQAAKEAKNNAEAMFEEGAAPATEGEEAEG
jgi:large subunit ribosomal protein L9